MIWLGGWVLSSRIIRMVHGIRMMNPSSPPPLRKEMDMEEPSTVPSVQNGSLKKEGRYMTAGSSLIIAVRNGNVDCLGPIPSTWRDLPYDPTGSRFGSTTVVG
jgi:hypothetical protein